MRKTMKRLDEYMPLSFTKFLNDISVKNKLIMSYILVVLIPVTLVGLILTYGMRKIAIQQAVNETVSSANKTERDLEEIFKTFIDVSDRIYVDNTLKNMLAMKYQSSWEVVLAFRNYTAFNDYINYYKEIKDIQFYISKDNLLGDVKYINTTDEIKNYPWYEHTVAKKGLISWEYTFNESKLEYFLSLTRFISNTNGAPMGVLVMDMNKDFISSILKNDMYLTMVASDQGYIIAAKDYSLVGKTIKSLGLNSLLEGKSDGVFKCAYEGKKSMATVKSFIPQMSNSSFKIISIFPTAELTSASNWIIILGFSIIAASFILALVLILIFSKAFSNRVGKLIREMHSIALGNMDTTITVDGEDEFGLLSKDLSVMVKSINRLIHEVYEVNLQKNNMMLMQKEIRYKMLASQVNPHFLFNALEAIRMKAHAKGETEIAEKVKSLGKILRTSLETGNNTVRLEKEIDLVKNYLELQAFRFGDKIKYLLDIHIHPEYKILPFIIQPIVENAVVHGLESKEAEGVVALKVSGDSGLIKITVSDNGLGMDYERLECIRNTLDEQDNTDSSIGLRNVHQRIQLHYGKEYGLTIESEKNTGTKVQIVLPEESEMSC